jgi:hypothetical protein
MVREYVNLHKNKEGLKPKIAILRHDIDRKPNNALRMAKLEYAMDIYSTYYFRYPYTFKPDIIRQIQDIGHEIGYHYEVLAKAKGNPKKAIRFFEQELQAMRDICEIKTICMHGSPLSPYDNRHLWEYYDFKEYEVTGEAYLSMSELQYYSDTGRNWCFKHSIRDHIENVHQGDVAKTTDDLINIIASGKESQLYLSTHPERWADSMIDWYIGGIRDFIFNTGKIVLSGLRT